MYTQARLAWQQENNQKKREKNKGRRWKLHRLPATRPWTRLEAETKGNLVRKIERARKKAPSLQYGGGRLD